MKNKKLHVIIIATAAVMILLMINLSAANIDDNDAELIDKAVRIYGLIYDGDHDAFYLGETKKFIRDEYTEKAGQGNYVRLTENFRTKEQMLEHYKTVFSDKISSALAETETIWLKTIDGQTVFLYDAKIAKDYRLDEKTPIEIISQDGNKTVYKLVFEVYRGTSPVEYVDKTLVIENTANGRRITGGTFIEDILLQRKTPETADSPIYAVAAAALLSLCGAAVCRKKTVKEI